VHGAPIERMRDAISPYTRYVSTEQRRVREQGEGLRQTLEQLEAVLHSADGGGGGGGGSS
jgi:hypothetical protein